MLLSLSDLCLDNRLVGCHRWGLSLLQCIALLVVGGVLAAQGKGWAAEGAAAPAAHIKIQEGSEYVVCISEVAYGLDGWNAAAQELRKKYGGTLIEYGAGAPEAVLPLLRQLRPTHVAFVMLPTACDREFVVQTHRMMRRLDEDPYADALWGIVTGYDASDVLRIAREKEPLVVSNMLGGCGVAVGEFQGGEAFSECHQGKMWTWRNWGALEEKPCAADATTDLVGRLNSGAYQCFMTSGHATERDWQIGFSFAGGQFRCRSGQLFGIDTLGREHAVTSPSAKVYLAPGNCLIGRIPDKECMALAWIHTGGARQLVGYTVSTWHGAVGWGVRDYWSGSQAGLTLSEAFFASTQAAVFELEQRFPKTARANMTEFNIESDMSCLARFAEANGIREKDNLGLLWDRDTVAFYGDPAWAARVAQAARNETVQVTATDLGAGMFKFSVQVPAGNEGSAARPAFAMLPFRVKDATFAVVAKGAVVGAEAARVGANGAAFGAVKAVAPGAFVMWREAEPAKPGTMRTLEFTARRDQ